MSKTMFKNEELERSIDNLQKDIRIKTTPNLLTAKLSFVSTGDDQQSITTLYYYCVKSAFCSHEAELSISQCSSCHGVFESLHCLGLAFARPLSVEVAKEDMQFAMREGEPLSLQLCYLGSRSVSITEIAFMQRFHQSILCKESGLSSYQFTSLASCYSQFWIDPEFASHSDFPSPVYIPPADWTASSNGSWYLLFPASDISLFHASTTSWSAFIRQSANQAAILCENLRLHRLLNLDTPENNREVYPIHSYKSGVTVEDVIQSFEGMIVSRGFGQIYHALPTSHHHHHNNKENDLQNYPQFPVKTINHIAKFVVKSGVVLPTAADIANPQQYYKKKRRRITSVSHMTFSSDGRDTSQDDLGIFKPVTFVEMFMERFHPLRHEIQVWMNDNCPLFPAIAVTPRTTAYIFADSDPRKISDDKRGYKEHHHNEPAFLLPWIYRPLGPATWFHLGLTAPSIINHVSNLLVAHECLTYLRSELIPRSIDCNFPSVGTILTTLTPLQMSTHNNYERLECLGDSYLKYTTSVLVYNLYPRASEGAMHDLRRKFICNAFLLSKMMKHGLEQFIRGVELSSGRQELNIRPPGMIFDAIKYGESLWNKDVCGPGGKRLPISQDVSMALAAQSHTSADSYWASIFPIKQYQVVTMKAKVVADVFEAILGALFLSGGAKLADVFLYAMGCTVPLPTAPPDPIVNMLSGPHPHHDKVCALLKYRFKQHELLSLALTHRSFALHHTCNNQRLEFMGDAVLDFCFLSLCYHRHPHATPAQLTSWKINYLNNKALGRIGVVLGLRRFIRVADVTYTEKNDQDAAVVKACADALEAIFGAVYLDCEGDLQVIEELIYAVRMPLP